MIGPFAFKHIAASQLRKLSSPRSFYRAKFWIVNRYDKSVWLIGYGKSQERFQKYYVNHLYCGQEGSVI
jgi:hypothetical protein